MITYSYVQYARLAKTVEKVRILEVERSVAENIIKSIAEGFVLSGTFYFLDEKRVNRS